MAYPQLLHLLLALVQLDVQATRDVEAEAQSVCLGRVATEHETLEQDQSLLKNILLIFSGELVDQLGEPVHDNVLQVVSVRGALSLLVVSSIAALGKDGGAVPLAAAERHFLLSGCRRRAVGVGRKVAENIVDEVHV